MKKLVLKGKMLIINARDSLFAIAKDERGEGFLDVLIKILITVIIGAALLALLRIAIPDLFQDILDKIRNVFTI